MSHLRQRGYSRAFPLNFISQDAKTEEGGKEEEEEEEDMEEGDTNIDLTDEELTALRNKGDVKFWAMRRFIADDYINCNPRLVALLSCILAILFILALAGFVWGVEYSSFVTRETVAGPPGPPGDTNITDPNGTVVIGSDLVVATNITLGDCLIFDTNGTTVPNPEICWNGQCMEVDAPYTCVNNLNFTDGSGEICGDVTFKDNVLFQSPTIFQDNVTIGGVTFAVINPTDVLVVGNLLFSFNLSLPVIFGPLGYIDDDGSGGLGIFPTNYIYLGGNVSVAGDFISETTFQQLATFLNGICFDENGLTCINVTGSTAHFYSNQSIVIESTGDDICLISPTKIKLDAPIIEFLGTINFNSSNINDLIMNGTITFLPGDATIGIDYDGCLAINADCISLIGNLTHSGGTFTFNGSGVIFGENTAINSSVTINENLTVLGDTYHDGDVFINGDLTISNGFNFTDLIVSGNATINGDLFINGVLRNVTDAIFDVLTVNNLFRMLGVAFFQGQSVSISSITNTSIFGPLKIGSLPDTVFCDDPVFRPDTLVEPNPFACIPECPDHARCDDRFNSLYIFEDINVANALLGNSTNPEVNFGAALSNLFQFRAYADLIVLNSSDTRIVQDILDGNGDPHPCCTGAQTGSGDRVVEVIMSNNFTNVSQSAALPFDTVVSLAGGLTTAWNTGTYSFTAPLNALYTFTISLKFDAADSGNGTFRGITMVRSFSTPALAPTTSLHLCTQFISSSLFVNAQITCTYSGFFEAGDSANLRPYHDASDPLLLVSGTFFDGPTSTRLTIYRT